MEPNRQSGRDGRATALVRIVVLVFAALALLGVGGGAVEPSLSESTVVASEVVVPGAAATSSTVGRSVRRAGTASPARTSAEGQGAAWRAGDETATGRPDPGPPDPRGPPAPTAR